MSMSLPTLDLLKQAHVLIVGDVMLDRYWYGAVDRISPEAPVPVVRVTREEERLGGCANVAYNVVTLGAQASLLSVLGDDDNGERLSRLVAQSGIQAHWGRDAQLQTTVKLRIIGRQQQLLRADFESEPQSEVLASQSALFQTLLAQHQAVLFSDYGKGGLTHVAQMIGAARAAHLPVLIDPKGSDYSRYAGATVITPNRAELQQVIGRWRDEASLLEKAQNLRQELQLDALLLTRSEEGMSLFDAQGALHVPAQAREVFDVTGAGDTVIATLASLLASGMTLRDALPWANKAGGVVVGKFGTAGVSYQELSA
ncbi:MAG: hypothetical protein RI998_267 [Pseudomonadota bacterium]